MARKEILLDLIERIYSAAEDVRLWPEFLERLTRQTHAGLAAMVFQDLRSREASVAAGFRFEGPISHDYEKYYASKNAWMQAGIARFRAGDVVTSQGRIDSAAVAQRRAERASLDEQVVASALSYLSSQTPTIARASVQEAESLRRSPKVARPQM